MLVPLRWARRATLLPQAGLCRQSKPYLDEVWNRKYEPGPIRDGDRFDRIDLCAYSASGALGITELVSDLNFCSRGRQFQSGRSGPLEAPQQKLSSALREQHNALPTEREIAPKTPCMGSQSFRNLQKPPQPSPSSHMAWGLGYRPKLRWGG